MQTRTFAVPAVLLWAAALSAATPLAAGMRMPAITLADQHDVKGAVLAETRCVLFSRDMDAAKVVNEALGDGSGALIEAAGAVVVSDISGMPRLISKLFAVPAMRKRPYRMLLDREGEVTADFPSVHGKVTVLHLAQFTIERVEYVDSADALRTMLSQTATTPRPEHPVGAGEH